MKINQATKRQDKTNKQNSYPSTTNSISAIMTRTQRDTYIVTMRHCFRNSHVQCCWSGPNGQQGYRGPRANTWGKTLCVMKREFPRTWHNCKLRRPYCYPLFFASSTWKAFVLGTPTPNVINRTNENLKRRERERENRESINNQYSKTTDECRCSMSLAVDSCEKKGNK